MPNWKKQKRQISIVGLKFHPHGWEADQLNIYKNDWEFWTGSPPRNNSCLHSLQLASKSHHFGIGFKTLN